MPGRELEVLLVGVGGYGAGYARVVLEAGGELGLRLAGVADPLASRSPLYRELERLGVPVTDTVEEFYRRAGAELAVVSSPIQFHCPQTVAAAGAGSDVLCEKPLAATVEEGLRMLEARERAGVAVSIGYQWSISPQILRLKRDIMAGRFGAPGRFRCLVLWPRDEKYYRRAGWAGRLRDDAGRWVLDSPVNNACAHFLHNMLFLLGGRLDASARPRRLSAELYRANDIENYDTGALRVLTEAGNELLFLATHAVRERRGPLFRLEFEEALVEYGAQAGGIRVRYRSGGEEDYGEPAAGHREKLAEAARLRRQGGRPVCGIEAALPHTMCVGGAQESAGGVTDFPRREVVVEGEPGSRRTWVRGLGEALADCYERFLLPAEAGLPWARPGRPVDLAGGGGR